MAKRKPANGQAIRNRRPGIQGDQVQQRISALPRSRRSWTFEMMLTEMPTEPDDHPLAGICADQRGDLRAQAFGRVLAAIAIRKTASQSHEPEAADGREEVVRQSPAWVNDGRHHEGEERWN